MQPASFVKAVSATFFGLYFLVSGIDTTQLARRGKEKKKKPPLVVNAHPRSSTDWNRERMKNGEAKRKTIAAILRPYELHKPYPQFR